MEQNEELSTYASDSRKVPNGREIETMRGELIHQFYQWWKAEHPEKKIYNEALCDYIHVNHDSLIETVRYAKLSYSSTLAVLNLDYILSKAILVKEVNADPNTKSQRSYQKMLIMRCFLPDIGDVRLVVGVRRSDVTRKVQYSITVINLDKSNGFRENTRHKRKTNRR